MSKPRSVVYLTAKVTELKDKLKTIQPEITRVTRINKRQTSEIDDLKYTVDTLRTLLRAEQYYSKEVSIKLKRRSKNIDSKGEATRILTQENRELKETIKELEYRLKANENIKVEMKVEMARPSKHSTEYWKSLYLSEIKRKK